MYVWFAVMFMREKSLRRNVRSVMRPHRSLRNRVKRQIREAYRKNKALLISEVEKCENKKFALAFIYLADELMTSETIEESIRKLLARLSEKVANSLHNEENR